MRAIVLLAVASFVALSFAAPPAAAGPVCDGPFEPGSALDDTYYFACGRADCLIAGLPNIMVTCF